MHQKNLGAEGATQDASNGDKVRKDLIRT